MSNKVLLGAEARATLKKGMDTIHSGTSPTLGANGRNVVYNKFTRMPVITNDGVTIAREIVPADEAERQGAELIKQVAIRTDEESGDGTTTSITFAHSMVEKGEEILKANPKLSPMRLREQIKEATNKVLEELKKEIITIDTLEDMTKVATISVEDPIIGAEIAKVIMEAGANGKVYVSESDKIGVTTEKVEGYQFRQGLVSPYLIMDVDNMQTTLEDVMVLVTEIPLHLTNEFMLLVDTLKKEGKKNLLVVCDEFHPDVLKFAAMNMAKDFFNILIVKKPMQREFLEDFSVLVGATAMTSQKGMVHPKAAYLGHADKVTSGERSTTVFGGSGTEHKVTSYINALKVQAEEGEDEVVKTKAQERLAALTGGIYILNVGERNEAEEKYLRLKVDDAVNAVRAAKEQGIIRGGGAAMYHIGKRFLAEAGSKLTFGEVVVYLSCLAPLEQIVKNSGEDFADIDKQLIALGSNKAGFDALQMKVVPDMLEAKIVDPVKVTKSAFENAASFASLFLTTEVVIVPIPQKE